MSTGSLSLLPRTRQVALLLATGALLLSSHLLLGQATNEPAAAPPQATQSSSPRPQTTDGVIDLVFARERDFIQTVRHFTPRIETYLQMLRPDAELGYVPISDQYFLGRVDLRRRVDQEAFIEKPVTPNGGLRHPSLMRYQATGFEQMMFIDTNSFDRRHYQLIYVGREFLGDVRCLVFDASPRKGAGKGRFAGRIWVEDQDYHVVRFKGSYVGAGTLGYYFHFDSWRTNVRPRLWLPSVIYTQELRQTSHPVPVIIRTNTFKGITRIWGYDLRLAGGQQEFTTMTIQAPAAIKDRSDAAADISPVESEALWEQEAAQNVLDRLEKAGLLAPPGDVDKILETVVGNLMATNNLDITPDVHCRVLLTTPLESFTVGHTIVLSRGLIDVLPDEASLAAMLAHELAHIVLAHSVNTDYAFNDRMMFDDAHTFQRLRVANDPRLESEADKKAMALLNNSPYADKLANAGLFIHQLSERAPLLPNLISAHLGNRLYYNDQWRMAMTVAYAPQLDPQKPDQIAALQIGSRIKIDPWNGQISMMHVRSFPLVAARQKMPFEVTPEFPNLTRYGSGEQVAEK